MTRALRQSGVQMLDIGDERRGRDRPDAADAGHAHAVVYGRATTAESQLELAVRFKIVGAEEKELVPERWARATRTYLVDTNNLVGSNQQQRLMDSELRSDVVQQIMRSVGAAGRQLKAVH